MNFITKYKVCRLVGSNEFGVHRYQMVSAQVADFEFKDEAENWIANIADKDTDYVIVEIYIRK